MAFTVDIYVEEASTPGVWTLIVSGFNAAIGSYGWQPDEPGTYRFRVELFEDGSPVTTGYTNWVKYGESRALTTDMRTLLGGRQRQDRTWLFVEDADGVQRDRSSYLTGWEIAYDLNSHTGNATVSIRREHGPATARASLAPDVETSTLNRRQNGSYGSAIEVGRAFSIWVGPAAADTVPNFDDHAIPLFCGDIDKHNFASSDASFIGRDLGGRLEEWIEDVRTYGAPEPGIPVQDIIAQILLDNHPDVRVFVPVDIDVELGIDTQDKEILLDALRAWAGQAGADLRYMWDDDTGTFRLTLYQTGDGSEAADFVFGKNDWFVVNDYSRAIYDIKNALVGQFVDDNNVVVQGVPWSDPESIEKYRRRRWMEFPPDAIPSIRTMDAWDAFARSALRALSEPDALMEIRVPMFWPVQLNRMYGFEADGLRFTAQRKLACVGFRHVYQKAQNASFEDTWDTYITVRGKPSVSNREFFQRERKPSTPTTPPGSTPTPPATLPPSPPDPAAMRISAASAVTDPDAILYDIPPALVTVSWTVENPDLSKSVSIDRQINSEGWVEVVTGLAVDGLEYDDTVDDYVNRPGGSTPPVTHRAYYRIRVMDGVTVLLSRTTGGVPVQPN